MYKTGYPTTKFTWNDKSGASSEVLNSATSDGLNVPFGFIMAERGTPGAIYFGGAKELTSILGNMTFTPSSKFYNASTKFIATSMAGQGVEVMRLVDPAATKAELGLFCSVVHEEIVQYSKAVDGSRLLDTNGDFIPLKEADGITIVTEPGVTLKWSVRALASNENFNTLATATVIDGSVTTVTYPIAGFEVSSVGAYGNRQGFQLFSTTIEDSTIAQAIGSVLYRFVPMELATDVSTTASGIPDVYNSLSNDVSFKDVAVYDRTGSNYAFKYTLGTNYVDPETGESKLPYSIHTYGTNVATIGAAVLLVSPELDFTDPYLVDLISGADLEGNLYDHVAIDAASSTVVNDNVVNYALGGTDGDTSFTKLQELIRDWLSGSNHGEFTNLQQHPMTHFSDPGFTMPTKLLLFNMLDLRDNFKVDVSTQDILLPLNTQAQDMSAAQTLMFSAQMHQESAIAGVGCTRVGIYAHAGDLVNGSPYDGIIPFTMNRLIQRRDLDGGLYIKGSSGGLPNSQVTIFRKPNWVADDESVRKLAWGRCANVVMHASRTVIFYPSLRTVYTNDTSLLSDDEISDRIIYMFKIARAIWAKYAGVRRPGEKLYPLIESDIDNDCASAFSSDSIRVKSTVFQTASDANLGYEVSVNLALSGAMPLRQMNFNVLVSRATA